MNLPNDYDTWRLDTPKHWDYDDEEKEEDIDPSPYCSSCQAMSEKHCDCGPIAEND